MSWRFWERAPSAPRTQSEAFSSFEAWRDRHESDPQIGAARHLASIELQNSPPPVLEAMCGTCASAQLFPVAWHGHPEAADLREGLACPACGLNARQRAAFGLMGDRLQGRRARVYATEQSSPAYVWLRRRYPKAIGSEFRPHPARVPVMEHWLAEQGVEERIRDLDVTALALASASLDAIISFDVLEHVPDFRAALREFARCLRRRGVLVLTAPFLALCPQTLVRARLREDGSIEHLLPPEMHGDPISGGVLCWYHFGWDVLDAAREAGFARAEWHYSWAPEQALYGMWTMVATKA